MVTRIIFFLLSGVSLAYSVNFCTPENISANPSVAATCKMYDEVAARSVSYNVPASYVDYETETAHKMYLHRTPYPSTQSEKMLSEHFGAYDRLKVVNVDNDGFLRVYTKPIEGQKADFYCDSRFDLFTEVSYVGKDGLKKRVIGFLDKQKGVVGQLKDLADSMTITQRSEKASPKVSREFPIYCGKLKTNGSATYPWESQECSDVRALAEKGGKGDRRVENELRSGNIVVESIYVGSSTSPKKVCTINYKLETTYDADCQLTPEDMIMKAGDTQESKLRDLSLKYTASKCCGRYPNAFIYIENPFAILLKGSSGAGAINDLIRANFGALNLDSTIKCTVNTESSGYRTQLLMEKTVEPSVEKPFEVGCGGITYTGVYEQNVIDRLNNYKDVLNVVASPYTKCCQEDTMSNIQKYGYAYSVMQCIPEIQEMITNGTYKGVKVSDSIKDAYESCSRHLVDTDVKGGVMANSSLINGGVRITQGFSGTTNFLGCLGEEIADMESIKLIKGCVDSNYKEFMSFIEWLVSQQLTLNIGIERFKTEVCREELDRNATLDLVFDLNDYMGSGEASSGGVSVSNDSPSNSSGEGSQTPERSNQTLGTSNSKPPQTKAGDSTRVEEGKNYYGVMKVGNQYIPALTLQDEYAFNATNMSRPFMGMDAKEHPTFLYAELFDLFGLKYDNVYMANFTDGSIGCKKKVFENVKKLVETKIRPLGELKTVDGFIHLYATNARMMATGEVQDIGLFSGASCSKKVKEDVLIYFNVALKRYIRVFMKNKPKTLKEAELGLVRQTVSPDSSYTFGYDNTVPEKDANGQTVSNEPAVGAFKTVEEYIVALKDFIGKQESDIKESQTQLQGYYDSRRSQCGGSQPATATAVSCSEHYNIAIQQTQKHIETLTLKIIKLKETLAKHESTMERTDEAPEVEESTASNDGEYSQELKMIGDLVNDGYYWGHKNIPYVWGARDPSGWDCSGFVQYLYKVKGINIPWTSYEQAHWDKGIRIDNRADLRPADLVFFLTDKSRKQDVTHVGMFLGNGNFVHAWGKKYGTVIANLEKYLKPNPSKWRWGRRIINTGDTPFTGRTLNAYSEQQYIDGRYLNESYDKEKYEAILKKYEREELDKTHPVYLRKKSLEIYQNMKRNKEINYYKNINLLKKSIGAY